MTDWVEIKAQQLAERINGGSWSDPQWYTEEQRDLWREHARVLFGELWTIADMAAVESGKSLTLVRIGGPLTVRDT